MKQEGAKRPERPAQPSRACPPSSVLSGSSCSVVVAATPRWAIRGSFYDPVNGYQNDFLPIYRCFVLPFARLQDLGVEKMKKTLRVVVSSPRIFPTMRRRLALMQFNDRWLGRCGLLYS